MPKHINILNSLNPFIGINHRQKFKPLQPKRFSVNSNSNISHSQKYINRLIKRRQNI